MLCGVHTINTLLQGPVVNETDLATVCALRSHTQACQACHPAQIALDLDALEAGCMAELGTHTDDYQRFQNEGSNNVSADGNFSVQVLHKALEVFGLTATPLGKHSPVDTLANNACTNPEAENAYICHMMDHWFSIRKVNDQWWNFNSLLPAPEPLSPFHLNTLISLLQNERHTVFVIRGNLPDNMMSLSEDLPRYARLFTPNEV